MMLAIDPAQVILWGGWTGLFRILVFGTVAYVALVLMLRITGKRTLSKMNAFDLVITVALGSTLASVLLDTSVPLVDGLVALGVLVLLQFAVTWVSVRSPVARRLVKAEPTVVARDGCYLDPALRRQRVTRDEVDAALRAEGHDGLSPGLVVLLETNGTFSVVKGKSDPSGQARARSTE